MLASCRHVLLRVLALPSSTTTATTTLNRLAPALQTSLLPKKHFGVTAAVLKKNAAALEGEIPGPRKWPLQNDRIEPPPESPDEPPREAWVVHYRSQIRYSPKRMLPIAQMIRGMSVDEAIKQLSFVHKKGAKVVIEVLREAQELAVREHNVEYRSNLWVAESFCGKGATIKGIRRHARGKLGIIHYRFCHYFVRLVEGPPPDHYYDPPLTPSQKLQEFIQELRDRRIDFSL